ncbi:erythromycin esterase family protein [Lentzea sp.]|uniref:erythromycin esterase family protein n=1 Tax=Lentzea sp. TaxID=56099 RepID=UPI002C631E97|nr:erythromycin esterase family protein [Lentzea sp.]HUQ61346.1 erythromycin esterase family protein [Lentzea sp.]
MSQDIREFISPFTELLAFGEPTHLEHAHTWIRNELVEQLAGLGYRSIALETCRVRGLLVDDYVQGGPGDLDTVMEEGFSHSFGRWPANRELVQWMREYNEDKPEAERLAFHGFDFQTETVSAPSPRPYLEHARDYLGEDVDLTTDDGKWSRVEAVMDLTQSPGQSGEAVRLREIGTGMLKRLHERRTADAAWYRAETHLTAGLSLLRYHRECAEPNPLGVRLNRLCQMRDGVMARNLLEIRRAEASRGPTFVFAHNAHLQRTNSSMEMAGERIEWFSAGALVAPLLGDQYTVIAGTLGRNDSFGLGEPDEATPEGQLQSRFTTWGITADKPRGPSRTDTGLEMGYFPLDQHLMDGVDALLHVRAGRPVTR